MPKQNAAPERNWVRIPVTIAAEQDRRTLCAILAACGLEVRVVRVKTTARGTPVRYVEFRPGPEKALVELAANSE